MAIKGAIFDMDGTLTDSMHLWVNMWKEYPLLRGVTPTEADLKAMRGMMLDDMAKYMIAHMGMTDTPEELVADINRQVEPGYFSQVEAKPTVVETLERLKEAGVKMVVATATDRYLTEGCLTRLGLMKYFDRIYTAAEYGSKYESQIFKTAFADLGTPQEETYVFEDTLAAIQGAKRAGLKVIAVADKWSAHNRDKIIDTADFFYENLGNIDFSIF